MTHQKKEKSVYPIMKFYMLFFFSPVLMNPISDLVTWFFVLIVNFYFRCSNQMFDLAQWCDDDDLIHISKFWVIFNDPSKKGKICLSNSKILHIILFCCCCYESYFRFGHLIFLYSSLIFLIFTSVAFVRTKCLILLNDATTMTWYTWVNFGSTIIKQNTDRRFELSML